MSNKKKAFLLARLVVLLMRRMGVREVRLPLADTGNLPDLGLYVDAETGEILLALGDDPA